MIVEWALGEESSSAAHVGEHLTNSESLRTLGTSSSDNEPLPDACLTII